MSYQFPPLSLLKDYQIETRFNDSAFVDSLRAELANTLDAYKVRAAITGSRSTPFAVMFDVQPEKGVRVKAIKRIRTELEIFLGAPVEITGIGEKQYTVVLTVKDLARPIVGLKSILESKEFNQEKHVIPIAAGMDLLGKPLVFDLANTPHLLVAGTTGSGKSTFVNDIILSILFSRTPEEVRLILVDPRIVELSVYSQIPHLEFPIVSDTSKSLGALRWANAEMDQRYRSFSDQKVRDINAYNEKHKYDKMSRIVVLVDEYMEMMFQAPVEVENLITRLSRMGRAAGIHLILVTQRPSSDVITNDIKANIPCRTSFTVVDWRESKTILDRTGAERLLGNGDMLYSPAETAEPVHAQAAYVSDAEIDAVIAYLNSSNQS